MSADLSKIRWMTPEGEPVSCIEKLKVLAESLGELRQTAQDAFEDALLIGCDEAQIRQVLGDLIADLNNPYRSGTGRQTSLPTGR